MTVRVLLPFLPLLCIGLLLAAPACGPDTTDPFSRGNSGDDDDSTDENPWAELDRSAWLELSYLNVYPETSGTAQMLASWFPPTPVVPKAPIPNDMDTCDEGIDFADLFHIPRNQYDHGVTSLQLLDGNQYDLVFDPESEHLLLDLSPSSWSGEQEYTVRVSGGTSVPELELESIIGTPEILAIEGMLALTNGLFIEWYGSNSNSHVELRLWTEAPDGRPDEILWRACRLYDDGQQTLDWDELTSFNGQTVNIELYRSRSVNFEFGPEAETGVATGSSTVLATFEFPNFGDDDDDAADDDDDDDSAR